METAHIHPYGLQLFFCLLVFPVATSFAGDAAEKEPQTLYEKIRGVRLQLTVDPENVTREMLRPVFHTARSPRAPERDRCIALAAVADYYLGKNEPNRVMRTLEKFSAYEAGNLTEDRIPLFLAYARIVAAGGSLREALKRIEYARSQTEGIPHALALNMGATLARDTGHYADAVKKLNTALSYGRTYYRPKRVSYTEAAIPVPGADRWRQINQELGKLLKFTRKKQDIELYGEGFVYWRIARRHHLAGKYKDACRVYNLLMRLFEGSAYAEGARFHNAICFMKLQKHAEGVEKLEEFIREKPYGLWRGEALFVLGQKYLDEKYDARRAREYFERTVEWVNDVRRRQLGIELYMIPKKAAEVTLPPSTALTTNNNFELVPEKILPRMVINRTTTDWYLDRLAWRSLYYLGFFEAVDGNWEKARQHWLCALELNPQLQKQCKLQIGSLHMRLMCSCRGRCFVLRPYELRAYEGYRYRQFRLQIMLADFYSYRLKWVKAKRLYRHLIESRLTTDNQKAAAMRGLGLAMNYSNRPEKANKILTELTEKYPDSPSCCRALVRLGRLHQSDQEKAVEYFLQAEKSAPNNAEAARACLDHAMVLQYTYNKTAAARETLRHIIQRYPGNPWSEHAKRALTVNLKQGKEFQKRSQ